MTFDELLAQVTALLQREKARSTGGRRSYIDLEVNCCSMRQGERKRGHGRQRSAFARL